MLNVGFVKYLPMYLIDADTIIISAMHICILFNVYLFEKMVSHIMSPYPLFHQAKEYFTS